MSLRSSLIGLAASPPPMEAPRQSPAPRIPVPPIGFRMPSGASREPVPTVRPTSPPLHRSPMRAAVVASIAAGASVAAAWGLAVSPLPGGRAPLTRVPVASFGEAGLGASPLGATTTFPAARVTGSTRAGTGQSGSSSAAGSSSRASVTVPYWVVRARSSALVAEVGPVRLTSRLSAQSGP